jgi:hypothetical protein
MTRLILAAAVLTSTALAAGCGPGRADPATVPDNALPPIPKGAPSPAAKTDAAPGPLKAPPR